MNISTIKKFSTKRLRKNITKSISLVTVTLFLVFGAVLCFETLLILLDTIIPSRTQIYTYNNQIAFVFSAIICFFAFFPFNIGIKKWYVSLCEYNPPLYEALNIFTNLKQFAKTIAYGFIKNALILGIFAIGTVPIFFMAHMFKSQINTNFEMLNALFTVLFFVIIALLIFMVAMCIYFSLGFFFADYLFIEQGYQNIFLAIKKSFLIAKNIRKDLFLLLLSLFPYALLCFLIVPIFFVVPYIKTVCAAYARQILSEE